MQITLAGVGILSLFLIMLVPVYAEVIEISVEKSFYTIDEKISFSGNNEEGNAMISVVVKDPDGKRNYVIGTISNSEGKFETTPVNAKNIFSTIGIYEFTAFTLKEENGSSFYFFVCVFVILGSIMSLYWWLFKWCKEKGLYST